MTDNSKARPNAGQGVKVLAAGAVLMLFLGIIYVWSVFVKPVSEAMNGWDIAEVKLTASFMLSCFATAILIGGKLFMRYGARKVVLAGGLMMATGMLVSSFVSPGAAWLIYITYGAVSGFGSGLAYSTILSAAQKWFPHKRGLATGIIVGAFGFSTVIFAPLVEYLIAAFGVSASFRILAAVFCAATLLLFRLITLPPEPAAPPPDASPDPAAQRQYAPSEILRTSSFYMITVSLMFGTAAYFILNPSFVTLANERGAASVATMIVMMTGIANAIGRLTVPLFSDKFG
ncbi:MAG: MFS transporter, partial [Gracilibacteraceae bacterium]|nr:MFS transporter [Gracilibacteraceae bacterium]